jgi:hypothetical protein
MLKKIAVLLVELILIFSVFVVKEHLILLFIIDTLFLIWACRNFSRGPVRIRFLSLVWFTGSLLILINLFSAAPNTMVLVGLFSKVLSPFIFRTDIKVLRDGYVRLSVPAMWLSSHYSETARQVPQLLLVAAGLFIVWIIINSINKLNMENYTINVAILYSVLFLIVSMEHKDFTNPALLSFIVVAASLFICDVKGAEILTLLLLTPLPPLPFFFFEKFLVGTKCSTELLWISVCLMLFVTAISMLSINKKLKPHKVLKI